MAASYSQKGVEGRVISALSEVDLTKGLTFFNNRLCPYGHRAWLALNEKGVAGEYDYIHVELGADKPAWFAASVNPAGTVPTVWDSGLPVYESALIVEYLDDRWPGRGTALLPADAVARAAVRLFVARLDTAPFYKLLVSKGDEALTAASVAAIAKIEAAYGAGLRFGGPGAAGPYFLGAQFSAADVAILPFVDRFSAALPFYHGWDLLEHVPRLAAALAAVKSRPSWAATSQPPPFYIKTYEGYAAGGSMPPRSEPAAVAT